jgi:hypothetical protein
MLLIRSTMIIPTIMPTPVLGTGTTGAFTTHSGARRGRWVGMVPDGRLHGDGQRPIGAGRLHIGVGVDIPVGMARTTHGMAVVSITPRPALINLTGQVEAWAPTPQADSQVQAIVQHLPVVQVHVAEL